MPLPRPSKIVCVGRNYKAHAAELGNEVPPEPLLFLKPPSSLIGPGEAIVLPTGFGRIEYEGELALVIGKTARNLSESTALSFVAGFACANDVTARELQKKDGQWTRAKGFDTFCPVSAPVAALDLSSSGIETRVNGVVKQNAPFADMIFSVARILAHVTQVMTLEPGDLVLTGTPAGVGPLAPGDTVEIEIQGLGILSNPVR